MKDLFANLYNKVLSFFHQSENKDRESAKDVACNRLKLVLMQDRTNLSPAIMDRMRNELIDLLSKYLELDKELLDLNFEQEDEQMALMLSIPVIRAKEESEILALLEAEEAGVNEEEEEGVNEEEEEGVNEEEVDEDEDEESESDEDDNSDDVQEEKEETDESEEKEIEASDTPDEEDPENDSEEEK